MKKTWIAIACVVAVVTGCQLERSVGEQTYLRWVGDIEQNDQLDGVDFEVCNGDNHVLQYFNLGKGPVYSGEKSAVIRTFQSKYQPVPNKDQNGLIRIRFIVNCAGKAGRFRVLQSDYNYQELVFEDSVVNQLLDIIKGIEKWQVLYEDEAAVDYYMYLIFKMKDGQITEILP